MTRLLSWLTLACSTLACSTLTCSTLACLALAVLVASAPAHAQGYSPTGACPTHQWNGAYGSMTTSANCLQPSFGDLSGTLPNSQLANPSTTVAGQSCTLGSTCGLSTASNILSSDVTLNNTSSFFDGPSVSVGSTGTWDVRGSVTLYDTATSAIFVCKLWDGSTVIDAAQAQSGGANATISVTLLGQIASPAGNLKISCNDSNSTAGLLFHNAGGLGKSAVIYAMRVN